MRARDRDARTIRVQSTTLGRLTRPLDFAASQIRIPVRASTRAGDQLVVEVSFGPLADEVVLAGQVVELCQADPPHALLAVSLRDQPQLRYLSDVLGGTRQAAARCHRRHASNLLVDWRHGKRRHESRLGDISKGGAFIVSPTPPRVGDQIEVVFRTSDEQIRVGSVVSWVRPANDGTSGFGVSFKPADRSTARRLGELVQRHERPSNALERSA